MALSNIIGEILSSVVNPVDCLFKNTLCDIVPPVTGSIVRCDLLGGVFATHTGVWVGPSKIVEILEDNGWTFVRIVSPVEFLSSSWVRTGRYIYVASTTSANGRCVPLGSQEIADRALSEVGSRRGKYFTLCNNCHQFTRYCIEGVDRETSTPWGVDDVVEAMKIKFNVKDVFWRSTGLSRKRNQGG